MFRKISQTWASWEEMGCEAKAEEDRELSQLVFLGNLERKKYQVGSHTDYKTRSWKPPEHKYLMTLFNEFIIELLIDFWVHETPQQKLRHC